MNIVGVTLFNSTGVTEVDRLEPLSLSWLDELDAEGSFSLTVTYEQGTNIEIGSIVKFAFGESSTDYVFAGIVSSIKVEKSGESTGGVAKTFIVNGTGVRAMLADAVVYNSGVSNLREYTSQTAGYIFKTLFLEAQARSALTGMSLSFTNSLDSYGDAFTESLTIDVQVGSTMLDLSREHGELAVDVYVSPDLEVSYYNVRGDDLTITANPIVLRVGSNVSELNLDTVGPVKNAILVGSGEQGTDYTTKTDGGSISSYGRKETFLSLASTSDAAQITLSSDKLFLNVAQPSDSVTIQLDLEGSLPYIDFDIGDYVWLADDTGSKTKYRVRAFTFAQDANGSITIIPELGDVRADLDKRLARLLNRGERGKAEGLTTGAAVIGVTPPDLGIGGTGNEVLSGEIITYDPLTGEGTVDVSGDTFNFTNGSGFNLNVGDDILTTVATNDDVNYAVGFVTSAAFSTHELTNYIVPSSVAGTPRTPSIDMATPDSVYDNFMASGADFVAYPTSATNMLQVNISAGTSASYVFPSAVSIMYTNGTTAVASDGVDDIYFLTGGVLTTVNYASATTIKLAGYDSALGYCFVVIQGGTSTKAVQVHTTTGVHTVQDITATFASHNQSWTVTRCGSGYFIIWSGAGTTSGASLGMWVYNGTTASIFSGIGTTTRINFNGQGSSSSPSFTAATAQGTASLGRLDMEGGYLYWLYDNTGFYKMDLSTGDLLLYNNILPSTIYTTFGSDARLATIGVVGGGTVVIAGGKTNGSTRRPVFYVTDGVTTTEVVTTGPEISDSGQHWAIASGNGSAGYVYYFLSALQDYIVGATV